MSSIFPPSFGSATGRRCQRCGAPLPPDTGYCNSCGLNNVPVQNTPGFGQNQPPQQWGSNQSQPFPGASPNGGQSWGQPFSNNSYNPSSQSPFNTIPGQPSNPNSFSGVSQNPFSNPNSFNGNTEGPFSNPNSFSGNTQNPFTNPGSLAGNTQNPFTNPNSFSGNTQNPFANPNNTQNSFVGERPSSPFATSPANSFQSGAFQQQPQFNPPFQMQPPNPEQPTPDKQKRNVGMIIGIVVTLIALLGGATLAYTLLTANKNHTTTQQTPLPIPTPKGPALFSDSFQNNNNGWDLTSKQGEFSVKVGGGSMVLEDDNNKLLWEVLPGNKTYSNFLLNVDATLSKGTQDNGYGVFIRGSSNQNSDLATYYSFEIYGDGSYAIFKGVTDANGNSSRQKPPIQDFTVSSAIQKQGQVNHLSISANGPTISFMVNGQTLKTFTDNSYASGAVALFVSNVPDTTPGAQATFANFAIYPPQS